MTTTLESPPETPTPPPRRRGVGPGAGALNLLNGTFLLIWGLITDRKSVV